MFTALHLRQYAQTCAAVQLKETDVDDTTRMMPPSGLWTWSRATKTKWTKIEFL